jgi:hypothetical protein
MGDDAGQGDRPPGSGNPPNSARDDGPTDAQQPPYDRKAEVERLLAEDDTVLGLVWRYQQEGLTPQQMADREGVSSTSFVPKYNDLIRVLRDGRISNSPGRAGEGARRVRSWLKQKPLSSELRAVGREPPRAEAAAPPSGRRPARAPPPPARADPPPPVRSPRGRRGCRTGSGPCRARRQPARPRTATRRAARGKDARAPRPRGSPPDRSATPAERSHPRRTARRAPRRRAARRPQRAEAARNARSPANRGTAKASTCPTGCGVVMGPASWAICRRAASRP